MVLKKGASTPSAAVSKPVAKSGAKVAKSRNKETARAAMCAPGGFMSFRLYRNDEGAAKAAYQDIFSHSLNKNAALVRNRRFGSFS